jgi:hypothetical protein
VWPSRSATCTRIIRQCHDLPGKRLFEYIDEAGDVRPVTSADVNDYIREATGGGFTAKDYRTWAATLGAALLLSALEHPGTERACKRVIKQVLEVRRDPDVRPCRRNGERADPRECGGVAYRPAGGRHVAESLAAAFAQDSLALARRVSQ